MAIKKGISDEGGLFVPAEIPSVSLDEIKEISSYDYVERATFILKTFLSDFQEEEIRHCAINAYSVEKFGSANPSPVKKLNDNAYILELWHGPTCAFKDMALQILPYLLTCSIKKTGETKNVVILVATSGDTGKAALEGFKDVPGTKISVFYPSDGVSDIQKLQMITQKGNNVNVVGIQGNFDDAQNGVKAIFTDESVKETISDNGYVFSSANSINWGRLVPQIVYYFSAYCDMLINNEIELGEKINICVPTGNFGNILAAYYAKKMGLPVNKLIGASNSNIVLSEFINKGEYDKNREFFTTASPSMDILISSNLERLLFDLTDNNADKVSAWMNNLKTDGCYKVDDDIKEKISDLFWGGYCDDNLTKECIRNIFEKYNYTVDTHTAVAINVYEQYVNETKDETKTVIASTASPFKFNQSVLTGLGKESEINNLDDFQLLDLLSNVSGMDIPDSLNNLKNCDKRFEDIVKKDEMIDAVLNFLN